MITFLIFDMFNNLSMGALPASLKLIQKEIKLSEGEIGVLGSMIFVGYIIGSIVATCVFGTFKYKGILCAAFIGNALALFLFV